MNLWYLLALALGSLLVVGLANLIRCVRSAPDGFEDVDGFHVAKQPSDRRLNGGAVDKRHAVPLNAESDAA